jgi:hypothetical protein
MHKLTYKDILNAFLCHCRESGVVDDDRVSWDFEYGDKVRVYFRFILVDFMAHDTGFACHIESDDSHRNCDYMTK